MTITIGSYTSLPDPSEETIELLIRGTSYVLANGQTNHDNIDSQIKQRITLSWRAVTESNMSNLYNAALACFTANRTYVDIRGDTYTVSGTADRGKPKVTSVPGASLRYNVTITLEEV